MDVQEGQWQSPVSTPVTGPADLLYTTLLVN